MNYKQLKIPELVRMCNDKEITQTSKKKSDLIKALDLDKLLDFAKLQKAAQAQVDKAIEEERKKMIAAMTAAGLSEDLIKETISKLS